MAHRTEPGHATTLPRSAEIAPPTRLLTTQEAADYVGLAKNTLDKMRLYGRKDDNSPIFIKLGFAVRYRLSDLDAWIERNRAVTTSEYDPGP